MLEKMQATYRGFKLMAERPAALDGTGGLEWYLRVLDRTGQEIVDPLTGPWLDASEAQEHALELVDVEIDKAGEKPSDALPQWISCL